MSRPRDDETRTATATDTVAEPGGVAYDATVPSPGNTPGGEAGATLGAGATIGRYQIREVLGAGGMGVVYRAHDPELGRELAIKVVLPYAAGTKAQQRLLEEARAMAKLRHPNIVPVFDVGTTDQGVFIVMPLFAGGTLHDWLRAEKRPWRAVLETFMAAGRGLAAAHAAGLVHRDFKPKNVFLGERGEVLVGDFGIAAETIATPPSSDATAPASTTPVSTIAGTPAYMAPEQATGAPIDARADQYSFCISLWEGLHGERPTEAATRARGALATRGVPTVPAERRGAPAWLLAAVTRGFAAAPERRWPSMTALLQHVERRAGRARRLAIAGASVAVLVGLATTAAVVVRGGAPDPCPDPRPRLAAVWSPAIEAKIVATFEGSKLPYVAATLANIRPALARYAADWRTKAIEVCRASRVEHRQSPELLDKRMACLDRRLAALQARTSAFAEATPDVIERAVGLVDELPLLADCDQTDALLAVPLPASLPLRAQIADLERQLDAVDAMAARGRPPSERLAALEPIVATTRGVGFEPLHARALHLMLTARNRDGQSIESTARELIQTAAAARDDRRSVFAWDLLINELVYRKGDVAEARALEPVMEAAVTRAGSTPGLMVLLKTTRGIIADRNGEPDLSLTLMRDALAAADTPLDRAHAMDNVVRALFNAGRYKEAVPVAEETVAAYEAALGTDHPEVAVRLHTLATTLMHTGVYDRADAVAARALSIQRRALRPAHPAIAGTLQTIANLARVRGDLDGAEAMLRESVGIREANNNVGLTVALFALANVVGDQHGIASARPCFDRALKLLEASGERESAAYAIGEVNLAATLSETDCAAARPLAEHAAQVFERLGHTGLTTALDTLARCDVEAGRPELAIPRFERSLKLCLERGCPPGGTESVSFNLGAQLYVTGANRRRGRTLVLGARESMRKLGNAAAVAGIEGWMKENGVR